jgi:hypothetical protein
MKFTYRTYYAIIGFENTDYGYEEIEKFISKINSIVKCDSNGKLFPDWTVCFYLVFRKYSGIVISKKGNTLKNEKNREYNIIIPIPNDKEVSWGMKKNKFGHDITLNENKFMILPVNYNDFSNLHDFVVYCTKKTIVSLLTNGLTIDGKIIKFSEKTMNDIQELR